jgi:hypothetical protein
MTEETEIHPKRQALLDQIEYQELEEVLLADGHDHAILGLVDLDFGKRTVVAYSTRLIVEGLMNRDGMSWEEAQEFFDFNIKGAWVGPNTPVFVQDELFGVNFDESV